MFVCETVGMSEESTSDVYEENGESNDSEPMYTYYPFIKIENDGSVFIDGQPCNQDASQMSIESAEVLVLPFSGMVEQLEGFEDHHGEYQQVIQAMSDDAINEITTKKEDNDINETLHHDHNYDDIHKAEDIKQDINYTYIVERNICKLCQKTFNTPASLKRHVRTHTGERPFQCQICEKYFSQQSNLWKHVRTHTGERPFACPQCNKRFSQRANMKKHLVIHTGERPFVCYTCSRGFTQQANLSKHMRLHTGEKPFGCSYCDKRFTQRSNLQKHEHLHEGIKPYTCEICFQAFTQQSNLRKHEMLHNNIKKFVCDICNKGYVQKVSLMKHRQRCSGGRDVQILKTEMDSDEKLVQNQVALLKQYEDIEGQFEDDDDEDGIVLTHPQFIFTA